MKLSFVPLDLGIELFKTSVEELKYYHRSSYESVVQEYLGVF